MTRRLAVALLVCSFVAGGCASAGQDGGELEGGIGGRDPAGPGATSVPESESGGEPGPHATAQPGNGPTTSGAAPRPNTPSPARSGEPGTTVAPTTSDDDGRTGPPGAYARHLLRPQPATSTVVEVIAQPGAAPRASTIDLVRDTLEDVTGKPVAVTQRSAPAGVPEGGWDVKSLVALADASGAARASAARAVVRYLAVEGRYAPNADTIGVAVRGDVFATFTEQIRGAATPLVPAEAMEHAVAVHEVGHLLGLVDVVLDRNRDDPEHPHHSRNRGSVMFWAIETDVVGQILGGPPPREFDAEDLADLAALRAGA